MALTEATKNKMDALVVVALAASSLFVTIGGYIISEHGKRLDRKDDRITQLEISFAAAEEHIREHDRSATHWIKKIIDNEQQNRNIERRLDRLETKPKARPDPFTGTDGARLERMIRELQQKAKEAND